VLYTFQFQIHVRAHASIDENVNIMRKNKDAFFMYFVKSSRSSKGPLVLSALVYMVHIKIWVDGRVVQSHMSHFLFVEQHHANDLSIVSTFGN